MAVGATIGGIGAGALIGMGIPKIEAKRYEAQTSGAETFRSPVHTENSDEIKRAKTIFTQAGAQDICTTAESTTPEDHKTNDRPAQPTVAAYTGHGR